MLRDEFTLQNLDTEDDINQELDLVRKVFGRNSGVDAIVMKFLKNHPLMTLKNHFIVKYHDSVVACLILIPVDWSIGKVQLKVAEMGIVATHPEYRRRGLMLKLISEYHRILDEQGYDLSAIEGIPFFYRKFGYEYALPLDEETTIPVDNIPDFESTQVVRYFEEKDVPHAMRLLAQNQKRFYVHSLRNEQIWRMQEDTGISGGDKFQGYVVEKGREVIAYFRIREKREDNQLVLRECSDADESTGRTIVGFLKKKAKEGDLSTLAAHTSYDDPITDCLVSLGGAKRVPPYAWQIRIMDYEGIFRKMKPLFQERLDNSSYRNLTETVTFNLHWYTVKMSITNGEIVSIDRSTTMERSKIWLNPLVFPQLLLGYRDRHELQMFYPDFIVRDSHKQLVDVLFPKLPSYIHTAY